MSIYYEDRISIYESDDESVTTLSNTSDKLSSYQIVVYNQHIYVVGGENKNLQWASDYFNWKIGGGKYTEESFMEDASFSIEKDNKALKYYRYVQTTMSPTEAYAHYISNRKIISESEVPATHLELLKSTIIKKMLDIPSKEEIAEREKSHADIIKSQIEKSLLLISPSLYKAASNAKQSIVVEFSLNEAILTNQKKYPRFINIPCADGTVRESFNDYVYYVCGQIFERHTDDTDPKLWIGSRLAERIRKLFPHLSVECVPSANVFPDIRIGMNIEGLSVVV
jgi:hypothetical protein